jgi:hypothetical protein
VIWLIVHTRGAIDIARYCGGFGPIARPMVVMLWTRANQRVSLQNRGEPYATLSVRFALLLAYARIVSITKIGTVQGLVDCGG